MKKLWNFIKKSVKEEVMPLVSHLLDLFWIICFFCFMFVSTIGAPFIIFDVMTNFRLGICKRIFIIIAFGICISAVYGIFLCLIKVYLSHLVRFVKKRVIGN